VVAPREAVLPPQNARAAATKRADAGVRIDVLLRTPDVLWGHNKTTKRKSELAIGMQYLELIDGFRLQSSGNRRLDGRSENSWKCDMGAGRGLYVHPKKGINSINICMRFETAFSIFTLSARHVPELFRLP
jgi:hypothetical protein